MQRRLLQRLLAVLVLLSLVGCNPGAIDASGPTTPSLIAPTLTEAGPVGLVVPGPRMQVPRAAHAASLLQDGSVLITGGFGTEESIHLDTAELFMPTSMAFSAVAPMTVGRCCHTSSLLRDGRVLIAGGFDGDSLASAEVYDPLTGEFTPTGSLTSPRRDHVAVLLETGEVLLAGGVTSGWTFLSTAELYDPASGTFTPTGSMALARESHTATLLNDGRVLITGGHQGRRSQTVVYDSAEIYDPREGTFTSAARMRLPRHKHDAVLMADGTVLISGGSASTDDQSAYVSTEVYNPSVDAFTPGPDMPSVRYKHVGTSLLLPWGGVLLAAGARQAAIYDPALRSFTRVPGSMGSAALSRLFATATHLGDGTALIAGGYGIGQPVTSETWVYSP